MTQDRTREIALTLTAFASVTDSDGESRFGPFLADYLRSLPAFAGKNELVRAEGTKNDPRERSVVYALVRGTGSGTVILTGHYDVVSIENYGPLAPFAFEPEALSPRLVAELKDAEKRAAARGQRLSETEARTLRDLESGEFLPGRGLLDMKAGLAAGIAVLEDFAADPKRQGNLLFIAVPDEEGASHGMRSAVERLPKLCAEWGLEPRLAINLDAAVDQASGEAGRAVFLGSVGKTHPFVLFLGRPSHAGAPFDGINPSLLGAEFVRRVECAPALLGGATPGPGAEAPPPPTVLYHRDLRPAYDVTSPAAVFTSLNVLSTERSPGEVLDAVEREAGAAMEEALTLLRERGKKQATLEGRPVAPPDRAPRTIRWSELATAAKARDPEAFAKARAAADRAEGDAIAGLAEFIHAALRLSGLEGPLAVIGLAPPYYPRAALKPEEAWIATIVREEAAAFVAERGESLILRPAFPGISDMSHLSPLDSQEARREAAAESPLEGPGEPAAFRCPAINLGPWGREYHQRHERLHAGYAFGAVPALVARIARRALA